MLTHKLQFLEVANNGQPNSSGNDQVVPPKRGYPHSVPNSGKLNNDIEESKINVSSLALNLSQYCTSIIT